MQYALILFLAFLFYPTTSFSMLTRARRQESQRRIQERVKSFQSIDEVNGRIVQMKNDASKESIQEFAHITGIPYETAKIHIDQTRALVKEALKFPNPDATHDPAIPAPLYATICKSMSDEGMNPQSTTLIYKAGPEKINSILFAEATSTTFYDGLPRLNPHIQFYSPSLQVHQAQQAFICEHELRHVVLHHSLMGYIAKTSNPSANQKILHSAQEKEADIYAASKNAYIARTAAMIRCTSRHAAIIDHQEHCQQMQLMYALMKRKEELS